MIVLSFSVNAQKVLNRLDENLTFEDILFYSFETSLDQWEDHWNVKNGDFKIDSNIFYEGKRSLSCIVNGGNERIQYFIPVNNIKGDSLYFGGWIKYEAVKDCDITMSLYYSDTLAFDHHPSVGLKAITGSAEWEFYSNKVKYLPSKYLIIDLQIQGDRGQVWFDNLVIEVDGVPISNKVRITYSKLASEVNCKHSGVKINTSLSKKQLLNLESLCKIWGFLKYYHPIIAEGEIDWDQELFKYIPLCIDADRKELNNIFIQWINSIGDVSTFSSVSSQGDHLVQLKPDWKWLKNSQFTDELQQRITELIYDIEREDRNKYVSFNVYAENLSFSNENYFPEANLVEDIGFRVLALFRFWNAIQYCYPYRSLIDLNWHTVLHDFLPRIMKANSEMDIQFVLMELASTLNDSHAAVSFNGYPLIYTSLLYPSNIIPANVVLQKRQAVVRSFNNETWEKATLKVGDIIKKVNGIKIDRIIKEKSNYFSFSTPEYALNRIYPLLTSLTNPIQLTVLRNGQKLKLDIDINSFDKNYKPPLKTAGEGFKFVSDSIAYIYLAELSKDDIPTIYDKIKHTKGLIIDIRCYPKDTVRNVLSDYLFPNPRLFAKETRLEIKNPGTFTFQKEYVVGKNNLDYYKGKVIVLVDNNTISQSEFIAMALKQLPNSIIIGSRTAGANGSITFLPLPGNMEMIFTGNGIFYPNGEVMQRKGVLLDKTILIPKKMEGNDSDYLLLEAISLIK